MDAHALKAKPDKYAKPQNFLTSKLHLGLISTIRRCLNLDAHLLQMLKIHLPCYPAKFGIRDIKYAPEANFAR